MPDVAIALNNLGVLYGGLKNYEKALIHYGEALNYREQAVLAGRNHFFQEWERLLRNIIEIKDSAETIKDYTNLVKAEQLLAVSYDQMKDQYNDTKQEAVLSYSSLSWWALFTKDYALAEKAALRCLELDDTKEFVLTNLGHSQLLQGQYQAAMATYQKLKGKKDNSGKDYKVVLLDDLKTLETEGVSHKSFAKARRMINKW